MKSSGIPGTFGGDMPLDGVADGLGEVGVAELGAAVDVEALGVVGLPVAFGAAALVDAEEEKKMLGRKEDRKLDPVDVDAVGVRLAAASRAAARSLFFCSKATSRSCANCLSLIFCCSSTICFSTASRCLSWSSLVRSSFSWRSNWAACRVRSRRASFSHVLQVVGGVLAHL